MTPAIVPSAHPRPGLIFPWLISSCALYFWRVTISVQLHLKSATLHTVPTGENEGGTAIHCAVAAEVAVPGLRADSAVPSCELGSYPVATGYPVPTRGSSGEF